MIQFQNLDLIEIPVNFNTKIITLPQDGLYVNKKINRIYAIPAELCPVTPLGRANISAEFYNYIYFSAFDKENREFIRSLSVSYMLPNSNVDIRINRMLNFKLTNFAVQTLPNELIVNSNFSILLLVEYQSMNRQPIFDATNTVSRSVSIPSAGRIPLSIFKDLITGNVYRMTSRNATSQFLTLRDKTGKVLNQVPAVILDERNLTDQRYFDSLDIDWENSYAESAQNNTNFDLTLYYE